MSAWFKKLRQETTRLAHQALGRMVPHSLDQAPPTWSMEDFPKPRTAEPVHPLHIPDLPAANDGPGSFSPAEFSHAGSSHQYKLYRPHRATAQPGRALPLVLMLHGCTQNPDDFATGTGMNAVAQEHGFVVLYPAQSASANTHGCWNWFKASQQTRHAGEPAWLAALVHHVMAQQTIDPQRIYVAGLSAGGAMASILGHTYPDLFAAVGVHSGLACGVAGNVLSGLMVMKTGRSRAGSPSSLPTIVFHGDADHTVHPHNGQAVLNAAIAQARQTTIVTDEGSSPQGLGYTRDTYYLGDGPSLAEHWKLHGAGHAWSGGNRAGSYTDPLGPDASAEMWRFFAEHPRQTLH